MSCSRFVLAAAVLCLHASGLRAQPARETPSFERAFAHAAQLPRLQALVIARHGRIVAERRWRGPSLDAPVNVKSISKSILSALVGIAIGQGKLRGVDQPIAPFFGKYLHGATDPRLNEITIGQLLSMQSGLVRTSGPAYAAWVGSKNWIQYILSAPLMADPGGPMIYSTGNSHLLSAILTQATGKSTYAFARDALAKLLGIALRPWQRDPQGIFFGGNQMRLSAHALVRFGELYRNHGRYEGVQVVPEAWVRESLQPRATSIFSGQDYGYGWFVGRIGSHPLFYAWGYGGQFVFVVPDLELTVVTTSAPNGPRDFEHLGGIYDILSEDIIPVLDTPS
ncbi:MAG TPA: serine hydrolase [Polyangiales bacterium]|nr:serine hydrolase [Polyangiales bacterium]